MIRDRVLFSLVDRIVLLRTFYLHYLHIFFSEARREFAGFRGEKPLSVVSWVDWHAGWSRLCRNQEEVSIQPENHPAHLRVVSLLASRISPHYAATVEGTEGKEKDRKAVRRNNFVTCPIRRRSSCAMPRILQTGSISDLRPVAERIHAQPESFFSSLLPFFFSPR